MSFSVTLFSLLQGRAEYTSAHASQVVVVSTQGFIGIYSIS